MKEKLQRLYDLKGYVETEAFQINIMQPLFKELDKLKDAYDCESLREMATLKGKKQGLMFLVKRLKEIENEIKNLRYDIENTE